MHVRPLVERELRTEARGSLQFAIRVIAVIVLTGVFALFMSDQRQSAASLGSRLFVGIHVTLLFALWVFGPAVVADCLSQEKRQGTLALLFLTGLEAHDIIAGKCFLGVLRMIVAWLAILPILTIPFLLGGLSWLDVVSAWTIQICSMVLVLAVGMIASAISREWVRAFLAAVILSVCTLIISVGLLGLLFLWHSPVAPGGVKPGLEAVPFLALLLSTGGIRPNGYASQSGWSAAFASAPAGFLSCWITVLGEFILYSGLVFVGCVYIAARRVQAGWRDEPLTARQIQRRAFWLAPRFWSGRFRRAMARKLDRNPMVWLQQYSTTGRLSKWPWCLVIIAADFPVGLSSLSGPDLTRDQAKLFGLVLLGIAFSAANTFRNERETGALELLLVTPLKLRQIVAGRLIGLGEQYFPAMAIGLSVWFWSAVWNDLWKGNFAAFPNMNRSLFWPQLFEGVQPMIWLLVCGFLTVPLLGFVLSLSLRNFVVVWLGTFVIAVAWPLAMPPLIAALSDFLGYRCNFHLDAFLPAYLIRADSSFWPWLMELLVLALSGWWLFRCLMRRTFLRI